jgi:hypothetical protein
MANPDNIVQRGPENRNPKELYPKKLQRGLAATAFGLTFLLAGCNGPTVTPTVVPLETSTRTAIPSTATPRPTETPTAVATVIPPTKTPLPPKPTATVEPLPTPRPNHIVKESGGTRQITLLGQEWTKNEIDLANQRLTWVQQNDPTLYTRLFEFGAFRKGNEPMSGFPVGICTGNICTTQSYNGSFVMTFPSPTNSFTWGQNDNLQSSIHFDSAGWHEYGRLLSLQSANAYQAFNGVLGSTATRFDQFATALGWLAAEKMEKKYGQMWATIVRKNGELKYLGLLPTDADPYKDYGIDLSYLYTDPGILLTGMKK